ncbi:MAG: FAD-binding oxidoreductase, partial [Candidatus Gastranaerophilales bacterium]|nr:FAD-binding oxidoreductase [Candidatus Gastranaerophilales bacterium]
MTQLESKVINRLKEACGAKNVLMEYEDRYCYAYDATAIGAQLYLPDAVVLPENAEQVSGVLKIANENRIPVVTRGAGTNLVGGCIPLKGGIVLHTSKMNRILNIDRNNLQCTVE